MHPKVDRNIEWKQFAVYSTWGFGMAESEFKDNEGNDWRGSCMLFSCIWPVNNYPVLLFIMQFDAPVILKFFFLINNEKPH